MKLLLLAEEPAEGFRFTQGWGSVGTITVGLLALIIATVYNRKTLDVSAHRHAVDRRDKYNESVRNSVVRVATQVLDWTGHCTFQRVGMSVLANDIETAQDPHMLEVMTDRLREEDRNSLRTSHRQLHSALLATRLLTTDEHIAPTVSGMLEALYTVRDVMNDIKYDSPSSLRATELHLNSVYSTIIQGMESLEQITVVNFPFVLDESTADTAARQRRLPRIRPQRSTSSED